MTAGPITVMAVTVTVAVAVTFGAAVGSLLRWWVMRLVSARSLTGGVAWVNLPAAAIAGVVVGGGTAGDAANWPAVAALGVCGGLSTYSALSYELAVGMRQRDRDAVMASVAGLVLGFVVGLLAAALAAAAVTSR